MNSFCRTLRYAESVTKVHLANSGDCYTRIASQINVQSRVQARDAAELIWFEAEDLPTMMDVVPGGETLSRIIHKELKNLIIICNFIYFCYSG